jgi:hypothetical protein
MGMAFGAGGFAAAIILYCISYSFVIMSGIEWYVFTPPKAPAVQTTIAESLPSSIVSSSVEVEEGRSTPSPTSQASSLATTYPSYPQQMLYPTPGSNSQEQQAPYDTNTLPSPPLTAHQQAVYSLPPLPAHQQAACRGGGFVGYQLYPASSVPAGIAITTAVR